MVTRMVSPRVYKTAEEVVQYSLSRRRLIASQKATERQTVSANKEISRFCGRGSLMNESSMTLIRSYRENVYQMINAASSPFQEHGNNNKLQIHLWTCHLCSTTDL